MSTSKPFSDLVRELIEPQSAKAYARFRDAIRPVYGFVPNVSPAHLGPPFSFKIVEQGAHDELLKRNGYYARLHRHQQSGVVVA